MGHEAGAIRHCTIQVQQAAVWRLKRIDVMCRQEGGGAVRLDLQGMKGRQAGGRGQGQRAGGEVQWMRAGIQDRTGRGGQAGRVGRIVAGLQCQPRQTSGSAQLMTRAGSPCRPAAAPHVAGCHAPASSQRPCDLWPANVAGQGNAGMCARARAAGAGAVQQQQQAGRHKSAVPAGIRCSSPIVLSHPPAPSPSHECCSAQGSAQPLHIAPTQAPAEGRGSPAVGRVSLEARSRAPGAGARTKPGQRLAGQATNWQATKEGCSSAPRRLPRGSRWALWGAGRAPRQSCGGGLTARGSGGRQSPPAASAAGRGRGWQAQSRGRGSVAGAGRGRVEEGRGPAAGGLQLPVNDPAFQETRHFGSAQPQVKPIQLDPSS